MRACVRARRVCVLAVRAEVRARRGWRGDGDAWEAAVLCVPAEADVGGRASGWDGGESCTSMVTLVVAELGEVLLMGVMETKGEIRL